MIRAYIEEVAKLPGMVREGVQETYLHKVEIRFIDKMLCNFWLDECCIFINTTMPCSRRKIVPSGVTLLFLLFVLSTLLSHSFRDLLCRFTGALLTPDILLTMKLLQKIFHQLNCGLSMVSVLCSKLKIHKVPHAQQGICEGNTLAHQNIYKSRHKNWNIYSP